MTTDVDYLNEQLTRKQLLSILVVDDTIANVRLLATLLSDQGYKVRKALDGEKALSTVKASLPDLILLDINMPKMDGYEVCKQLKETPEFTDIPVIFISALDDVLDKVKAFEVGAVDYIAKPFHAEEVLARVSNQLTIKIQKNLLMEQNKTLHNEIAEKISAQKALVEQQLKTEQLLRNTLPQCIVDELKLKGEVTAREYSIASFMFLDIVQFTAQSAMMSAVDTVALLNEIFSAFDQCISKVGVEKIRTIGDSYFIASGVPEPRDDHVHALAHLALTLKRTIKQFSWSDGTQIRLRIGINSGGPVVASVIGEQNLAYDVWGTAVNIASRMESLGQANQIQVSEDSYQVLKQDFVFEACGVTEVRGSCAINTYSLVGLKTH